MSSGSGNSYVLGHHAAELQRLLLQSEVWAGFTEALLRRAGLGSGMRVLDIGSGTGDVAMIAARIVGDTGQVLGIDRAPQAVEIAALRARAGGLGNLRFELGDITQFEPEAGFDAITGRFILLHLPDPVAVLKKLARSLVPGGVLILQEPDISAARTTPVVPLFSQSLRWVVDGLERAGARADVGSLLWSICRAVGIAEPGLVHDARIEAPPGELACRYLAETVRNLLPVLERSGCVTAAEVDAASLEQRLLRDVAAAQAVIVSPSLIGAWGPVS